MSAKASRKKQDSKTEILTAAIGLIRREGAASLTIEAVAEESGFSKGGVLYNFPTKDALITGMVNFLGAQFEADVQLARTRNAGSQSPTLSGMIDVTERWLETRRDIAQAILATTASRPELSDPFLQVRKRLKQAIGEEMNDMDRAMAIWAGLEGLHFTTAHSVSILSETELAGVLQDLRRRLEHD